MDSVIKSLVVYFVLWLVIRSTGRRTLGQLTVFDFILFLIIGGAASRALMAQDYSLTHAFLVIATFVVVDVAVPRQDEGVTEHVLVPQGQVQGAVPALGQAACGQPMPACRSQPAFAAIPRPSRERRIPPTDHQDTRNARNTGLMHRP